MSLRNAPPKAFSRKKINSTNQVYLKLDNGERGRGDVCGPVLFQFIPFHNYLVISTVTYSVEIYTPNINLKELLRVDVLINGEGHLTTGRKTVLNAVTTPETETQGYVIYEMPKPDCV